MTDSDKYDDTSHDYERFEEERIAQDEDAAQVETDDVDETEARQLVADLVKAGTVTPIAEHRILVHEPSETAFESIRQLAVFHRGWTAARNVDRES